MRQEEVNSKLKQEIDKLRVREDQIAQEEHESSADTAVLKQAKLEE